MTSICIVKFVGHGMNDVSFVPETCLQSSKNVKIKLNGDYLFAHKSDRQLRVRGKLLFKGKSEKHVVTLVLLLVCLFPIGSLSECDEYCQTDSKLMIDDSTCLSHTSLVNESEKKDQVQQKKQKSLQLLKRN